MPFFENRCGERLWYEDAGRGVPVLFVHGWCMSSAVWHYQFAELAGSFRVVAPDLRGHGFSRSVSGHLDFGRFATDLSDLISLLELKSIILVGWSMGAQIAIQAYREISDRLAGLVLVSATPCFTAKADFSYGLARNEAAGMRIKVGRDVNRAVVGFHARMFDADEFQNPQVADQVRILLDKIVPPDSDATIAALDSLASADMRDLLPSIAIPTLVINGDCDKICLPQASMCLAENIRSARQKVFPRSGHALFLTRHVEFNAAIAGFAESMCAQNV